MLPVLPVSKFTRRTVSLIAQTLCRAVLLSLSFPIAKSPLRAVRTWLSHFVAQPLSVSVFSLPIFLTFRSPSHSRPLRRHHPNLQLRSLEGISYATSTPQRFQLTVQY